MQLLPGSVTWEDRRGCLGVTWSVTWRYLECYLVLPGRYLGCDFRKEKIVVKTTRVPQAQTFEEEKNHRKCYPGPALVLVTWLPGPPSGAYVADDDTFFENLRNVYT